MKFRGKRTFLLFALLPAVVTAIDQNKLEICSKSDQSVCQNNGVCLSDKNSSCVCLCSKKYSGRFCEMANDGPDINIGSKGSTYMCQDVGDTSLNCTNNGICIVSHYGTKNQSEQCVCVRGYYGQHCEYSGRVVQTFKLSRPAWSIQGDSLYVYVTFESTPTVVSYKRNSSGLINGSSYENSVNTSLFLPLFCDMMATTMSPDGRLIVADDGQIIRLQTNPLALLGGNITVTYTPGGVAVDTYNYLWVTNFIPGSPVIEVFNQSGGLSASFRLVEEEGTTLPGNRGITITTPNDQLFVGFWTILLIYNISRNENGLPSNLTIVSTVSTFDQTDGLMNFNQDKWGNVLMSHKPQVEVYKSNNQLTAIIPPESNVFWQGSWTDPETGYVFIVGDTFTLYVIDYSDLVI